MEAKDRSALVLFSGGQDSTTCLAWALTTYLRVETVGFDYGQRHHVELKARQDVIARMREEYPYWDARLGADHVIDLAALGQISDTALTSEAEIMVLANGLPSTFVPGRNLAFFTFAAALAYRRGISVLVGGMCETDFSGYPDCRDETLKAMEQTLRLGMDFDISIQTPLMRVDKAGTWDMIERLGGTPLVNIVVDATHTCYRGERGKFHVWGYGCGACPACDLRAGGFVRWKARKAEAT